MQAENTTNSFAGAERYCMSEADCLAQGIDFAAYEKGVADAIAACQRLLSEKPKPASHSKAQLYLDVPFAEKEKVKSLGGRWDSETKKWFVPYGVDINLFETWHSSAVPGAVTPEAKSKSGAKKAKPASQTNLISSKNTDGDNVVVSRVEDGEIDLPW